jgi:flagellum-specific peptidoglycan hydrolase FlgJ
MKNLKKVLFLSLFIGLISLSFTKEKTKTIKVFKEKTEIYAGRFDKKPKKTKYNKNGLPIGRSWLTRDESKGKHIKSLIVKKRFKEWKKNYQTQFIKFFGAECKKEYQNEKFKTIPPALVIAQAILESNFALSRLASKGNNNLFGVKYRGQKRKDLIKAGYLLAYDDGPNNKFTRFVSQWAALRNQSYLLLKYGKRIKSKNPNLNDWLNALCGGLTIEESKQHVKNGGTVYATSCFKGKCYADKLRDIINFYNLERFNN